ncbi:GNAT family N-acetyltransferase [Denitrobaculum tricleocarpae]|uniref:GNAT family N-acetyltransferase n=2 Tax=Denitrobaculum tricleocarpae TaxID=2591009 RepID=A0A545TAY0_9PROT|nr:GNAT family N-acetyltransferase [Denitrobaculum tricleocarpae]
MAVCPYRLNGVMRFCVFTPRDFCFRFSDMLEIVPCTGIEFGALHAAMNAAFSDYLVPMALTPDRFRLMLRQRGYDEDLSWLAKSQGRVVGFWLIGSNGETEREAAYVIATGSLPEHRGQGIATRIFESVSGNLATQGIETLELEVIDQNTAARKAYEKLGFTAWREVVCFKLPLPEPGSSAHIQVTARPIPFETIQRAGPIAWDWQPTWQNSLDALGRIRDHIEIQGVYVAEKLAGYGIVIRPTATLAQLAVHPEHRRQTIGTSILAALSLRLDTDSVQIINAEASDSGFAAFVDRCQGVASTRQIALSLKV